MVYLSVLESLVLVQYEGCLFYAYFGGRESSSGRWIQSWLIPLCVSMKASLLQNKHCSHGIFVVERSLEALLDIDHIVTEAHHGVVIGPALEWNL